MERYRNKIILLVFCILSIYIVGQLRLRTLREKETALPAWENQRNIELMALMENRMASNHVHVNADTDSFGESKDYKELFPDLYAVYEKPKSEKSKKVAYLTFDDGPSTNTFEILDILQENGIKATFFIVGKAITDEGEDALRRMKNEGHAIGIHTYSHACNEIYCSVERFLKDFNMVYEQIHEITGERVNIYRFPWGSNNGYSKNIKDALMEEMERRGFLCYDWNVDANDSVGKPTEYSIRRNIEKDLKNQDHPIILLHDSSVNDLTVKTLPGIIRMLRDKGYDFDTLENREPYQFNW
jgi:peptidoglycan/xylan/chitin deacetylase (PgdA/CDA1 family)